jgi:hypothetical protein
MGSRPWLPHAAALRLKTGKPVDAVQTRGSNFRFFDVVKWSICLRFSPNGTTCGSHGRQPMVTGPPPSSKPQRGDMRQTSNRPFGAKDF